ncbi:MAG: magnesium transporter CorA [Clostridiales bacterium]|nr:magnesium transporter CorA [Clostridiales bacterium]
MYFFRIQNPLTECGIDEALANRPFVAVLTPEEWAETMPRFTLGMDMDLQLQNISVTSADVNYDSLAGGFSIPDRNDFYAPNIRFAFALDENGVVFIDDGDFALSAVRTIKNTKKWKFPSLERFLYDFLEQMIHNDAAILTKYELELSAMEIELGNEENTDEAKQIIERLNDIRGNVRDLRIHYEQLTDLGQELEDNENGFFVEENLRYFRMFTSRIASLKDMSAYIQDYTVQLRDYYESQIDLRQNRIMTVLTVVTSIFLPLTLITGWYGMNFRHMPELESPFAYPALILVFIIIVVVSIIFFKKKKWL